jgi:hypothetical protein
MDVPSVITPGVPGCISRELGNLIKMLNDVFENWIKDE